MSKTPLSCLIFIILLAQALPVYSASAWSCIGVGAEVTCHQGKCEAAPLGTPIQVYISSSESSVCAYSGCWEGDSETTESSESFYSEAKDLIWNNDSRKRETFQITFSKNSLYGTVVGSGFVTPITCNKQD